MNVKFCTWNMAHWSHQRFGQEAWRFFINELGCDVLLFQEAVPNPNVLGQKHPENLLWSQIGDTRNWGSGIYSSSYKLKNHPFNNSLPGAVVAAEIDVTEDFKPIVISLYGLFETILNVGYSIPNLHRIFSDLTGILEGRDTKHRVIIGGDLNASLQIDEQYPGNKHRVLFDRIEGFGLINCFDEFFDGFVQTHRHSRSAKPWQNDYFFISKRLESRLVDCRVVDSEQVQRFSDHNPVVIELEV